MIQAHTYEALSYVWGDASMQAAIICTGKSVLATISLCDASKRWRLSKKSRFIWADAICVDQNSALEKSCQIALMGKIYSSAKKAVIWLGSCDLAEAEGGLDSVKLTAKHVTESRKKGKFERINGQEYSEVQVPGNYYQRSAARIPVASLC